MDVHPLNNAALNEPLNCSTGGRDGDACCSEGIRDVSLLLPCPPATEKDPEQLFAAAWSAYFIGAGFDPFDRSPTMRHV